jgi:hypothetical protein
MKFTEVREEIFKNDLVPNPPNLNRLPQAPAFRRLCLASARQILFLRNKEERFVYPWQGLFNKRIF